MKKYSLKSQRINTLGGGDIGKSMFSERYDGVGKKEQRSIIDDDNGNSNNSHNKNMKKNKDKDKKEENIRYKNYDNDNDHDI